MAPAEQGHEQTDPQLVKAYCCFDAYQAQGSPHDVSACSIWRGAQDHNLQASHVIATLAKVQMTVLSVATGQCLCDECSIAIA